MNDNDLLNYLRETGYGDVLLAAFEQGHVTDETMTGADGTEHDVDEAGEALKELGLVHYAKSLAGTVVQANGRGKRVAKRIQQSREAGAERWDSVERAIISDLLQERTRYGSDWGVEVVDGREVTELERINAMRRLSDWGYLSGVSSAQANGFLRIDVTPKAAEVAGIPGLLADHHDGNRTSFTDNSTYTSTTFGDGNAVGAVMTGSHGSAQSVTITVSERDDILAGIDQVRAAMGDDAAPELVDAVERIETEARAKGATQETVRQQIQSALITAGTAATTKEVFQGLTDLLSQVFS